MSAHSYLSFDGMTWPDPRDPAGVLRRLTFGAPTPDDLALCVSVWMAYRQLVDDPRRTRAQKIAGLREAMRQTEAYPE